MTINPFTLKELRQLTRSKAVSGLLTTYLAACFLIAYIVPLSGIDQSTGADVFSLQTFVLSLAVVLVLPAFVFFRLVRERGGRSNADFTLMTALPPADVVDGKLRAAFAVIAVFASATMPFGVFCYLLHGIALVEMLTSLALTVCVACVMLHLLLCCGMMRVSRAFGIVLVVAMSLVFLGLAGVLLDGRPGLGGSNLALCAALSATACLFLRALSIALFTPVVMQRDRRLRLTTLALAGGWLAWTVFSCRGCEVKKLFEWLEVWSALSIAAALALAVFASVQPVGCSRRIMDSRPKSVVVRLFAWPFSSGAANGFFFAAVFGAAAALALPVAAAIMPGSSCGTDPEGAAAAAEARFVPFALLLYVLSALMVLRAVWRWLSALWRMPVALVPVLALGLLGIMQTLGPLMELQGWTGFDERTMPFCLAGMSLSPTAHLYYATLAFCAGAVLNSVAFLKAFLRYVFGRPAEAVR